MSIRESAKAVVATGAMDDTILELFLANLLPKTKRLCLKKVYKYANYSLRKYCCSDLYTVNRKTIDITADNQLLLSKAKEYAEQSIKKMVYPSEYEHNDFIYNLGKLFDNSCYTAAEKEFIDLMFHELLSIASIEEFSRQTPTEDLFNFNSINRNSFFHVARKVYNDILQKKLHAGDNVISYFTTADLSEFQIVQLLNAGKKYDCFYDKYATLKCDLESNRNILIKNFLNTVIYRFRDSRSRLVLLQKLNSQYPFLISEKIFYEFS